MKDSERKKIKFKRSRVIVTCILFAVSIGFYSLGPFIPEDHRYLTQLTVLLGTLSLIGAFFSFLKLFTYEIRVELYRRISRALVAAGEKWRQVKAKVRRMLGLPERAELAGADERRIVMSGAADRKKKKPLPKAKYSDMKENRLRVRFLGAKYVIDRASADDPPSVSATPREIGDKLADDEIKADLFALYRTARYAPEGAVTPDGEVSRQAKLVGTSGRI